MKTRKVVLSLSLLVGVTQLCAMNHNLAWPWGNPALAFARALLACGDFCGLGRRTYEQYASDARGVLSAHAKAILARHKSIP